MFPLIEATAGQDVPIKLFDLADHVTPKTGVAAPTITLSKNGGAFASPSDGAWAELAGGVYIVTLDATDTDTVGWIVLRVIGAGADEASVLAYVRAITEKQIYDRVGTPIGASISADLQVVDGVADATLVDTGDMQPRVVAIEADTDEMQGKLPTNNIMGSSVKTDKDDEIDQIDSRVDQSRSATEANIRGGDSDDLKDISDEVAAVQTTVDGISNVTRLSSSLPKYMERPSSGDKTVLVKLALKDASGSMEDPDSNDLALKVYNSAGTSRNANLYKDYALTTALDASAYATFLKTERSGVGLYEFYYKVNAADTEEELTFELYWEEGAVGLTEFKASQVVDAANDISAIKVQTDKMQFDEASRIIADAEAISASAAAADNVEANIPNLDKAITASETAIRGSDGDDLKDISDQIDAIPAAPSAAVIADTVWDEVLSAHLAAGSTGKALSDAAAGTIDYDAVADAVWDEALSGHAAAGSAGKALTDVPSAVAVAVVVDAALTSAHGSGSWQRTSGWGSRAVTITVYETATTTPIADVKVTVYDATDTVVVAVGNTDLNGELGLTLDDGDYKVRCRKGGQFSFAASEDLTVSGATSATYYGTSFTPTPPADPSMCTVYEWLVDASGADLADITVRAYLNGEEPFRLASGELVKQNEIEVTTDSNGYFELALIRSAQFEDDEQAWEIVIDTMGYRKRVIVPDESTKRLKDLEILEGGDE